MTVDLIHFDKISNLKYHYNVLRMGKMLYHIYIESELYFLLSANGLDWTQEIFLKEQWVSGAITLLSKNSSNSNNLVFMCKLII